MFCLQGTSVRVQVLESIEETFWIDSFLILKIILFQHETLNPTLRFQVLQKVSFRNAILISGFFTELENKKTRRSRNLVNTVDAATEQT